MNKWLEIFGGLIILIGSIYAFGMNIWGFGTAGISLLKGGIIWMLLSIGIVLILLGINDLKE